MMDDKDIFVIEDLQLTASERLYLPQVIDGMRVTVRHWAKSWFQRPITVQYPEEQRELHVENYRGVHRLNRDEQGRVACVACFMCATACPVDCIHIEGGEAPWDDREKYPVKFDIDELRCIYCGMCEEACPVDAIELTPHYDLVGRSREEMILDKEELLAIFDATKDLKPRKNPPITGYPREAEPPAQPKSQEAENAE
jgi:NADH-quinone oxidoreductase subunit I